MDRSFAEVEWKVGASAGKRMQAAPHGGEREGMSVLSTDVVGAASFNVCLSDAVRNSALEDQEIAARIHMSPGYMSRLLPLLPTCGRNGSSLSCT